MAVDAIAGAWLTVHDIMGRIAEACRDEGLVLLSKAFAWKGDEIHTIDLEWTYDEPLAEQAVLDYLAQAARGAEAIVVILKASSRAGIAPMYVVLMESRTLGLYMWHAFMDERGIPGPFLRDWSRGGKLSVMARIEGH